jgi:hypothetical protein
MWRTLNWALVWAVSIDHSAAAAGSATVEARRAGAAMRVALFMTGLLSRSPLPMPPPRLLRHSIHYTHMEHTVAIWERFAWT